MIDNCQSAGGSAVIVVNNVPGQLDVTLSGETVITIPAIGVTTEDGSTLAAALGKTLTVSEDNRYAYADGTSFASPHVAGAAAAIWQMCPACTNLQVRSCLQDTALDLGAAGRDDMTGSGLIQMSDAYSCLANTEMCCQSVAPAAPTPVAPMPTSYPTIVSAEPACASEELAYASCFTSEMSDSGASCAGCLNTYVYDLSGDCATVTSAICLALSVCDCDPCGESVETYYSCLLPTIDPGTSCSLICPDTVAPTAHPVSLPPTALPVAVPVLLPSTAPVLGPTPSPVTSFPSSVPPTLVQSPSTPASDPASSCDPLLETARGCLSAQFDLTGNESCQECVNSAIPNGVVACVDVEVDLCTAIDTCGCGTCSDLIREYFTCSYSVLGCSIDCDVASLTPSSAVSVTPVPTPAATIISSAPTPALVSTTPPPFVTPAPSSTSAATPPPSSDEACLEESNNYAFCFNTNLSLAEGEICQACIESAVGALSDLATCSDGASASVCEAIALCPCGECTSFMESFVNCKAETSSLACSLPCSNLTATSTCRTEREAYSVCLFSGQLPTNKSLSCLDCISASQTSAVAQLSADCTGVQAQACDESFENSCLGCGTCSVVAKDYLLCQLNERSGGSCVIDCDGASEGTPVPELDATPSPGTGDSGTEVPSTSASELCRISPMVAGISSLAGLWHCLA
jgi:Subtilase family/PA domain